MLIKTASTASQKTECVAHSRKLLIKTVLYPLHLSESLLSSWFRHAYDKPVNIFRFSSFKSIPALTTVDPNLQQTMGQLEGPSFLDVLILNLHYNCQGRKSRAFRIELHESSMHGSFQLAANVSWPVRTVVSSIAGAAIDASSSLYMPKSNSFLRKLLPYRCPSGYGGQLCETIPPSFSKGCGGELYAYEAVRRFDITIKQVGQKRTKQCFYHLKVGFSECVMLPILTPIPILRVALFRPPPANVCW